MRIAEWKCRGFNFAVGAWTRKNSEIKSTAKISTYTVCDPIIIDGFMTRTKGCETRRRTSKDGYIYRIYYIYSLSISGPKCPLIMQA